jgi:DNA-cytosine methyltransferase
MLKLLDLFSGIGGFSLGLESTGGFETIAFVEKDDFCQKVLKKHWPNTTIEGDIRNVKGDKYEADIITGGFPCQPFSVAGKRKGTDDDRYLWDETIRVVRECKPRWFIGENVEGLININNGVVLRQVQTDLEKEGFEVQCLVIPASGVGAWHQRKRIWIMGYSKHNGRSSTKIKGRNDKTNDNSEKRENQPANLREQVDPSTMEMYGWMLPTPRVSDIEGGAAKNVKMENGHFYRENKKGERWGVKLRDVMEMYPTPRASAAMTEDMETIAKRNKYNSKLEEKVALQMYPTPTQDSVSERTKKYKQGGLPLTMAVKLYPTPTTRDYKDSTVSPSYKNRNSDSLPIKMMKEGKPGGKLNPEFVEFLMGYPLNWTKLETTE